MDKGYNIANKIADIRQACFVQAEVHVNLFGYCRLVQVSLLITKSAEIINVNIIFLQAKENFRETILV